MATVGIDIGGTKVLGVLADGDQIHRKVVRGTEGDPIGAASQVSKVLVSDGHVDAIGLALAAWVAHPAGEPVYSPNIGVGLSGLARMMEEIHGLPIVVENDATAAAWAEHRSGAGAGHASLAMVTVGTGIGGGLVADGSLWRGARGFAGEAGHMQIDQGGPTCACGSEGCLEALASGTAIARMGRERLDMCPILQRLCAGDPAAVTSSMVADAASAGDEGALGILEQAGRMLGIGLFGLAMAFDPAVMVVGGGVSGAGEIFIGPAREEMGRRFAGKVEPPPLVAARFGNDAGALGAALLAKDRLEA